MKLNIKIASLLAFLIPFVNLYSQSTIKEEFTLHTAGGIELSGEINFPERGSKFPAAILIWGNGPHTRDQEISKSPSFKQIADHLCSKGMAVLRMDKPGFGKSTGRFTSEGNYTTRDLADDIKLAYDHLNKHPKIDTGKIGLIGHSEGSIIASMLAAEIPGIDWLIVYGVPAVRGDSIIAEQTRLNRQRLGISKEVSDAVGKVWERYFQFIESGSTDDSAYYAIGRDFLIAHGMDKDDKQITHKFIDQLLSGYKSQWNRYFLNLNAGEFFKKVHVPVLAVFGSNDEQTSSQQNMLPLLNALLASGNKQYRVAVLSDEDHFFLRYEDKLVAKHQPGKMQVSGRLLKLMSDWLGEIIR